MFGESVAEQDSAPRRTLTSEEIDGVRYVEGFPIASDETIIYMHV